MRSWMRPGLLAIGLAAGAAPPVAAQAPDTAAAAAAAAPEALPDTATLVVRNRRIVTFRTSVEGRSAAVRAAAAQERLARVVAERRPGDTVAIHPLAAGRVAFIGDKPIFYLDPGDLDPLADETLDSAAAEAGRRLAEVWAALLEERSAKSLIRGAILAVAATLLFLGLIGLLRRVTGRVRERTVERILRHGGDVRVAGVTVLQAGFLRTAVARAVLGLVWALGLVSAYAWLTFVLEQFPWTRPAGQALGGFLLRTTLDLLSGVAGAIPGLVVVGIIFVFTRWFTGLVRGFFLAVEQGRAEVPWLHADIAEPTRRIVGALIWIFAIVAAYPYLPGSESDVFKGLSVLVGIMLSLGSGSIIGQAMSGLALMYARALHRGEVVRIDDAEGVVKSLGMFSTKITTPRGEEITIPNGVVLGTKTVNLSRGEVESPLCTSVSIGYDTPWRQVEAMLLEAARRTAGVTASPAPVVLMRSLGDMAVLYELRASPAEPRTRATVLSALHGHVLDVFNEHGVQIMTPSYEGDPELPKVVPPERWYPSPAAPPAAGGKA
ncbi:MAG TPA: mechanosensitive ion channel domain-containing protein [Gemmatimonadales bacterium]|nr:mechanosensitive ion channel domain-containing protein [Gemmatimonadales bacterium]